MDENVNGSLYFPEEAKGAVDREKADGYQVKGTVELLSSGDFFEQVTKRQEQRKRPRPKNVVKIKIEEIYSIRPGMTAKKLLRSHAVLLGCNRYLPPIRLSLYSFPSLFLQLTHRSCGQDS